MLSLRITSFHDLVENHATATLALVLNSMCNKATFTRNQTTTLRWDECTTFPGVEFKFQNKRIVPTRFQYISDKSSKPADKKFIGVSFLSFVSPEHWLFWEDIVKDQYMIEQYVRSFLSFAMQRNYQRYTVGDGNRAKAMKPKIDEMMNVLSNYTVKLRYTGHFLALEIYFEPYVHFQYEIPEMTSFKV